MHLGARCSFGLILLGFIPIMAYAVWNLVVLAAEVHLLWRPRASVRSTRTAVRLVAIAAAPRLIWTMRMWLDDRVSDRWIVAVLSSATVIVLITSGLFDLLTRQGE